MRSTGWVLLLGILVGCGTDDPAASPATGNDAGADSASADVTTGEDSASADATTGEDSGGLDGAGSACVDMSGLYGGVGACTGIGGGGFGTDLPSFFCVHQTECQVTIAGDTLELVGAVSGGVATVTTAVPTAEDCEATAGEGGFDLACELTDIGGTCEGTYARLGGEGDIYCCDIVEQDCPDGLRCQIVSTPDTVTTKCIEVSGAVEAGEACERQGEALGYDDCAPGSICTNWGSPVTTERTCTPLCRDTSECADGSSCLDFWATPGAGGCSPMCDPFAEAGSEMACQDGAVCYAARARLDGQIRNSTGCFPPFAATPVGEACEISSECVEGSLCGSGYCREACNASNPCDDGMRCSLFSPVVPGFPEGLGVCVPE